MQRIFLSSLAFNSRILKWRRQGNVWPNRRSCQVSDAPQMVTLETAQSMAESDETRKGKKGFPSRVERRRGREGSRYLTKQSIEVFCQDPIRTVEMEKMKGSNARGKVRILHVPCSMLRVPRSWNKINIEMEQGIIRFHFFPSPLSLYPCLGTLMPLGKSSGEDRDPNLNLIRRYRRV